MPVDIDVIFRQGGKRLIDFLDYCVRSVQMDPLFLFLVREYRFHPTTTRAMVLYQMFCAVGASARISALEVLPPRNSLLEISLQPVRANWIERHGLAATPAPRPPPYLPSKNLFDDIAIHLRATSPALRRIRRHYRLRRTPIENLPEGRMSAAQRRFVDQVWQPTLRPGLVAAGFRHLTAIA